MKLKLPLLANNEQILAKELLKKIDLSANKNQVTHFLTPVEQKLLQKIVAYNYKTVSLEFFGGYEGSERAKAKIIKFLNYDISYEVSCLSAKFNTKFNNLTHRDVVGSVHSLGINFDRIGDIIIQDENIIIFADNSLKDYLIANLTRIKKANVSFLLKDFNDIEIRRNYETFFITALSLRADIIISKITNKSRSKTSAMFESEYIKINHFIIKNHNFRCKEEDLLSIRKYGRFILKNITQNKKNNKYRLEINKII